MSILIVDDHEDNLELILDLLEEQGYGALYTAPDGTSALEILEGNKRKVVDLVLLDINMPIMNGYQVLKHIKSSDTLRHIPVIMVSANDQLESIIRCIQYGADDYITKPVEETFLHARVASSLERKYLQDKERELFRRVQIEKKHSEEILYNVLPKNVAERLKKGEDHIADHLDEVTVLFADLISFTELSTHVGPDMLVYTLNYIFRAFDQLVDKLGLEKIKTIGDAYMLVGGIEDHPVCHAERCMKFAISALEEMAKFNNLHKNNLQLRIGMCTGPAVAGVIGNKRYSFDLWGETVNLASRMETLCAPNQIQVSESTHKLLADKYDFELHGEVEVKGKGSMDTYVSTGNLKPA